MELICKCGKVIPDRSITYKNYQHNGVKSCIYKADCEHCFLDYATDIYGAYQGEETALKILQYYINVFEFRPLNLIEFKLSISTGNP